MSGKQKPAGWGPLGAGPQRLNKVLAAAGLGSRRACDEFISEGRVEVNGEVVDQLGRKVDPSIDQIKVDGEALKKHKPVYYALNKPPGVVSTNSDPDGRPRVVDLVPDKERLFSVGRLDRSSEGLMLLTNDGELAQKLAHPKYQITKTYYVTVQGSIDIAHLARLERGIHLAEGLAKVDKVKIRKQRRHATDLEIELSEGKNREIRRVLAKLGHKVVELKRVAIGTLRLGDLPAGAYRPLSAEEVRRLYEEAELAKHKKKENRKRKSGGAKIAAPGPIDDDLTEDDLAEELEAERMLENDDLGVVVDYRGGASDIEEFVPPPDPDDEDAVEIEGFEEDDFGDEEAEFDDEGDLEDEDDQDELPDVILDDDGDEIFLPPSLAPARGKPRGNRERSYKERSSDGPRKKAPGSKEPRGNRPTGRGGPDRSERPDRREFSDRRERPARRDGGPRGRTREEGSSRERGLGDRPPRAPADRGFRDRDSRDRDSRDRGFGERGFGERGSRSRSGGNRSDEGRDRGRDFGGRSGGGRGGRPSDRPASDRGFEDRGDRPRYDRSRGPRSEGTGRPSSTRSGDRRFGRGETEGRGGGRPGGGRPGGGRPGGGRPGGGRPGGGRPGGGRPGGGRGRG